VEPYKVKSLKYADKDILILESDLFYYAFDDEDYQIQLAAVTTLDLARELDEMDEELDTVVELYSGEVIKFKGIISTAKYDSPIIEVEGTVSERSSDPDIDFYDKEEWEKQIVFERMRFEKATTVEKSLKEYPPHQLVVFDNIPVQENHIKWLDSKDNQQDIVSRAIKEYVNKQMKK
jgi:hypothetical protein